MGHFKQVLCRKTHLPDTIDIHRGTDVEFGQSIYEPFGIAPIEPLTFGGLCVFSNVCGCAGFVNDAIAGINSSSKDGTRNVIIAITKAPTLSAIFLILSHSQILE